MRAPLLVSILALALPLLAAPPSPLEAVLLGTGYPRPDNDHAGPSTAIVYGERVFVVDAGRGVSMRMAGAKLPFSRIEAVFLTHLHSDHTAGLPDLFDTSWEFGRSVPLELYGPPGTGRLARAILDFFHEDIHIRRDLVEHNPAAGARINTHTIREGVVYEKEGLKVTAFRVDHSPVRDAFGYRFEAAGKSIVISGDTRPNDNLIRHARGADVLIQEAYLPEWFDKVDSPEVAARLKSYHTSVEEAGEIASAAEVKLLVLTHLIPANSEGEFMTRASKRFAGRIVVGKDLLRVTSDE